MSYVWGEPPGGTQEQAQIHLFRRIAGTRLVGFTYQRGVGDWTWRVERYATPPMHLRPAVHAGPFATRGAALDDLETAWAALVDGADPATLGIHEAQP